MLSAAPWLDFQEDLTGGSQPQSLFALGDRLIFTANYLSGGREIWATDGTQKNTFLLKDLRDGAQSNPSSFLQFGDFLYFSGTDSSGAGLFRTDGTTVNTVRVADVAAIVPVRFGDVFLFLGTAADTGLELWRSDGTQAGTYLVKDVRSGTQSGFDTSIGVDWALHDGVMYFAADDGVAGRELWRTDGTTAGTYLVSDFRPGPVGSRPVNLLGTPGGVFFGANDGVAGVELCVSDGTAAGTRIVVDLSPGPTASDSSPHAWINNQLLFAGNPRTSWPAKTEMYSTDGTAAGTQLFYDFGGVGWSGSPVALASFNGLHFFTADVGNSTTQDVRLFRTDGTVAGTQSVFPLTFVGSGTFLQSFDTGDALYVQLPAVSGSTDVVQTDGTASGTRRITNFRGPVQFNQSIVGVGSDPTRGLELFKLDPGTQTTSLLVDVPTTRSNSEPQNFTALGDQVLFTAKRPTGLVRDLWLTDGTLSGTAKLAEIDTRGYGQMLVLSEQRAIYCSADPSLAGFWGTDGTAAGTARVTAQMHTGMVAMNGFAYFLGSLASQVGLFRTDGTAAGTTLIRSLPLSPGARSIAELGGYLYFTSSTGSVSNSELWRSDGTFAGTSQFFEIVPGSGGGSPRDLTRVGDRLFFSNAGLEPWTTDGTLAGTYQLADLYPGSQASAPTSFTPAGNRVFFIATDPITGRELYVSDGTSAGTTLVGDFAPGTASTEINTMRGFGEKLAIVGRLDNLSTQLWTTDGTQGGTSRLNPADSYLEGFSSLYTYQGRIFFTASSAQGFEPWQSDGTPAGTAILRDINGSGSAANFAGIGDKVLFAGQGPGQPQAIWTTTDDTQPPVTTESVFHFEDPDQAVTVQFSEPVATFSFYTAVTLQNLTTGSTLVRGGVQFEPSSNGSQIHFRFPGFSQTGLPDGNYRMTVPASSIADASGNIMESDFEFSFFVLTADVNRDRVVGISDFARLASRFNQTGAFGDGDCNFDGFVDIADFSILAATFGRTLPEPSANRTAAIPIAAKESQTPFLSSRNSFFADFFNDDPQTERFGP